MITKNEFIEIIDRLRETDELVTDVNERIASSKEVVISDFTNAGSMMICHEDIVIKLLANMFNDSDTLSWWMYELEYGRKYFPGCIQDKNGKNIDLSNESKLYDYLIEQMEV